MKSNNSRGGQSVRTRGIQPRTIKLLAAFALATAAAGAWAPLFGGSLTSVGVLDPNQPYSDLRAVSSDGTYVVGTSTESSGIRVPIVWSSADGLVALPNPSGMNSLAHGVAVGIDPTNNLGNIIISGLHEGNLGGRFYKAPLTSLASGSWQDTASVGGLGGSANFRGGTANNLRNDLSIGDGRWYTGGRRQDTGRNARFRGDPNSGWDGAAVRSVGSVSGYGVNVGRGNESISLAFYEGPAETYGTVPGSTGVRADGHGISSGFGKSASTDFDVQWICGQVQNYWTNSTPEQMFQAFRWNRADAALTPLGSLAPAGGGTTERNSSTAYCIANNGVTAGRSYFDDGTGEVATVWDTSGTWDNTGAPKNLKDLLAADGVDTSAWTNLTRVYAASDDGSVLVGFGVWAADSSTRGFVAVKTTTAAPVVQITNIAVSGGTVTVDFTSSNTSDTTTSFVVQQAATLVNAGTSFTDVSPAATITGSAGSFQATFSTSGDTQFYQIKRL